MAETRFLKTVTYGGYDKEEVIKKLTSFNLRIAELENQLMEKNMLLSAYENGSDVIAAYENAIVEERTVLSQVQADAATYEDMIANYEGEIKNKDAQIKELQLKNDKLEESLSSANTQLSAMKAGDDAAALGVVFIEAQKSGNKLKAEAKSEAEKIKTDAEKLAADVVAEANNTAAEIIYDAEKKAAIITTDAQNNAEKMSVASNNLKVTVLEDVTGLGSRLSDVKNVLETFSKTSMDEITSAIELLNATEVILKSGGVPTFQQPKTYSPKLPDKPEPAPKPKADADSKKKSDALAKLQKMADSMGSGKGGDSSSNSGSSKGGSGVDLSALMKQAESLGRKK